MQKCGSSPAEIRLRGSLNWKVILTRKTAETAENPARLHKSLL